MTPFVVLKRKVNIYRVSEYIELKHIQSFDIITAQQDSAGRGQFL